MSPHLRSSPIRRLLDRLDPSRNYGEYSYEQIIDGIHDGQVIIEEPREGDPPVLSDLGGRLLKGTGQRPGALSPRALGRLSWKYPRSYVDAREALEGTTFTTLRQRFRALGLQDAHLAPGGLSAPPLLGHVLAGREHTYRQETNGSAGVPVGRIRFVVEVDSVEFWGTTQAEVAAEKAWS